MSGRKGTGAKRSRGGLRGALAAWRAEQYVEPLVLSVQPIYKEYPSLSGFGRDFGEY